jgi:hypothetical protein
MSTRNAWDSTPRIGPVPTAEAPSTDPARPDRLGAVLGILAIVYGLGVLLLEIAILGYTNYDLGGLETMFVALPIVLLVGVVYAIVIARRGGAARTCARVCGWMMLAPFVVPVGILLFALISNTVLT